MITMKITGFNETIKNLGAMADRRIPFALEAALYKSSEFVLKTLKNNTPVDTENLRDSERAIVNGKALEATIGPDESKAEYARWVEFGHHTRSRSWVDGQFYLMRTSIETKAGVEEIFKDAIKLAVK